MTDESLHIDPNADPNADPDIDPKIIREILLADGWHKVKKNTFMPCQYKFLNADTSVPGAAWEGDADDHDADDCPDYGFILQCPLASILALRTW